MERGNRKKIIVITIEPFPIGLAGTNRIISYCKGFRHHGFQPEVLCLRPTDSYKNIFNNSIQGDYKGIKYSYPGRTTIRVASFWGRRINDISGILSTLKIVLVMLSKKEIEFAIFYGKKYYAELSFIFIFWLFRKKIYKEESEHPHVYFRGGTSVLNKIFKWLYVNKLYRYYSGILVMTQPLRDFYLAKGIPDGEILVVPQTVDLDRFENIYLNTKKVEYEYIAYVGTLSQQKDGVLTLINSFSIVTKKFPETHLIIAGDGTLQEKWELSLLINQLHLNEKVHFIGRISSEDIPAFFNGAKVLASCRPQSLQSDFGFPTKVVEYLASGKPTATTATGELAFYLIDRVNAFVANMAEPNIFGSKILEVLENYDFAMEVAENGKELVREKFSPIKQTKMIIDFYKG